MFGEHFHPPASVRDTWIAQYEAIRATPDLPDHHRVLNLTLHPQVSGHHFRLHVADQVLQLFQDSGAKFTTLGSLSQTIRSLSST